MPTRVPRVRLGFEPGDAPTAPFRPVFRLRVGAALLLGAFLAVLCLPAHRRMALEQLGTALTGVPPAWFDSGSGQAERQRRYRAVLARHPGDSGLHLAAALGGVFETGDAQTPGPDLDAIRALQRRFPNDPAIIAFLLRRLCQKEQLIPNRKGWTEQGEPARDRTLAPPAALAECRRLVEAATVLEPDNAFFPAMLACAAFGAGRDQEGLAALRVAAEKPAWREHVLVEAQKSEQLVREAFGAQGFWVKGMCYAGILLPHYADLRVMSRAAAWRAGRASNPAVEHAIRLDIVRLGALMRREAETPIGKLVAHAIQLPALEAAPNPARQRRSPALQDAWERERMAAYLNRVRREAPLLVPEAAREIEAAQQFRAAMRDRMLGDGWTALLNSSGRRDALGALLIGHLVGALAVWLLALLAGRSLRQPEGAAIAVGRIGSVLTVVSFLLCAVVLCNLPPTMLTPEWQRSLTTGSAGAHLLAPWPQLLQGGGAGPLVLIGACLIGVLATRATWRQGIGGLAIASGVLVLTLAAAEVGFLLWAVPADLRDAQSLAAVIEHERTWPASR